MTGATLFSDTPVFGTNPPLLEPFSSAGQTPIFFDISGTRLASPEVRAHPDVTGPDGVATTMSTFDPFFGTSAAAPHVAAVAALMLDCGLVPGGGCVGPPVGELSPSHIYSDLEEFAIDIVVPGGAGFDDDAGHGFVDALLTVGHTLPAPDHCRRVSLGAGLAPNETKTGTASCADGETVVGGGFRLGSNALVIHASRPSSDLDGWQAVVENTDDDEPHGYDVFGVCCPATCRRVAIGGALAGNETQTGTASCSASETVIGGGFGLGSNALVIHASQPSSDLDGWQAVVENTDDDEPHGYDVFGVCCPATCQLVSLGRTIAGDETQTATALCSEGETAVGGGFRLGSNGLVIHASQPTPDLDGWLAVVENTDDSEPHGYDVFAACCGEPVPVELLSFSVE